MKCRQDQKKLTEAPFILELGITVDPNFKVHTVEEYLSLRKIGGGSRPRAPTHYLDNRARAMVEGLSVEEVCTGMRVVEDICEFGGNKVYVLAKIMTNTRDEVFELVRCVSRFQKVSNHFKLSIGFASHVLLKIIQ